MKHNKHFVENYRGFDIYLTFGRFWLFYQKRLLTCSSAIEPLIELVDKGYTLAEQKKGKLTDNEN